MTIAEEERRRVIAQNLEGVRTRVAQACAAARREPADITLVAVTKTFPLSDVVHLAALGLTAMGENRDVEAAAKAVQAHDAGLHDLEWHFVGQVQRNKAASLATYADVVHSVDRRPLVTALDAAAGRAGRRLVGLVQVDLREPVGEDGRGGAAPEQVAAIAAAVAAAEHLLIGGVMAVAPLGDDPSTAIRAFSRLAEVSQRLRADHPGATIISAGMSGDLETAIEHGATHLRVGTALLGSRPPLG